MNIRPSARLRAFTLIELLTVIAIIGILAAILIPTVGKVRDSAHSATTVSRLRQLQIANTLHAADFKGFFAPTKTKSDKPASDNAVFMKYLDETQGWDGRTFKSGRPTTNGGDTGPSLSVSLGRGSFPQAFTVKQQEIQEKFPRMIMWADSCTWAVSGNQTKNKALDQWDDSLTGGNYFACVAFRHGGKANVALLDGSVRKLTKAEATSDEGLAAYFPPGTGTIDKAADATQFTQYSPIY